MLQQRHNPLHGVGVALHHPGPRLPAAALHSSPLAAFRLSQTPPDGFPVGEESGTGISSDTTGCHHPL